MELRLKLIRGVESGKISVDDFKSVQKTMAGDLFRHGRAARKMKKLVG